MLQIARQRISDKLRIRTNSQRRPSVDRRKKHRRKLLRSLLLQFYSPNVESTSLVAKRSETLRWYSNITLDHPTTPSYTITLARVCVFRRSLLFFRFKTVSCVDKDRNITALYQLSRAFGTCSVSKSSIKSHLPHHDPFGPTLKSSPLCIQETVASSKPIIAASAERYTQRIIHNCTSYSTYTAFAFSGGLDYRLLQSKSPPNKPGAKLGTRGIAITAQSPSSRCRS